MSSKSGSFQLSVPLVRNVKYPSDVKCASRVKCALRHDNGTLNFTCSKAAYFTSERSERLHLRHRRKLHRKDTIMQESKLRSQSLDFAVSIINLVKELKSKHETIISNQVGRSGTSIGANIREAQYAHGKPDFIAKLQIALKEANETGYWLELLYKTDYIGEQTYKILDSACSSIRVMLISSINTAKQNQSNEP